MNTLQTYSFLNSNHTHTINQKSEFSISQEWEESVAFEEEKCHTLFFICYFSPLSSGQQYFAPDSASTLHQAEFLFSSQTVLQSPRTFSLSSFSSSLEAFFFYQISLVINPRNFQWAWTDPIIWSYSIFQLRLLLMGHISTGCKINFSRCQWYL